MDFDSTKNPYEHYERTVQMFKELVDKKKDMEETFHPSMVKDYKQVKNSLVEYAVELLKLGVNKRLDEKNVYLTIDDAEYEITRDDMLKVINKKQWDEIFPDDSIQVIKAEIEMNDSKEPEEEEEIEPEQPDENVQNMANPFASFFTAMFTPMIKMMNNGNGEFNADDFANSMQNAMSTQKKLSLSEEVGTIQDRVIKLETERDEAAKRTAFYINKVETLENEAAGLREETAGLKNELEKKVKEKTADLNERLRRAEDDAAMKDANLGKVAAERDALKKELKNITSELEKQVKDSSKMLEDLKAEHQKKVEKLMSDLKNTEAELKNAKNSAETKTKKFEELQAKFDAAKADTSEIDKIVKDYEKKLKDSSSTISKYKNMAEAAGGELNAVKRDNAELLKSKDMLEKENGSLNELAYFDKKLGINNANAFNRDFQGVDMKKTVLVMTGIRGVKAVNEKYGRVSGDKLIKAAAKGCADVFGASRVYRTFSDHFAIISNKNVDEVRSMMERVKNNLEKDQISIVYGLSDGRNANGLNSMVSEAEGAMNDYLNKQNNDTSETDNVNETDNNNMPSNSEPEELNMEELMAEYNATEN